MQAPPLLPSFGRRDIVLVLRRIVFVALVAASSAVASTLMAQIMGANGLTLIGLAVLLLFVLSFTWLAVSFWTAILGFLSCLLGRDRLAIVALPDIRLRQRTAVVMPIFNEDTVRVAAGLDAVLGELAATG